MPTDTTCFHTDPNAVHATLKKHMLADGFPLVFDYERSRGHRFVDAKTNETYLDLFSFFASQPIGYNHTRMTDPQFIEKIGRIAISKPTNSDIYTQALADFVSTFGTLVIPETHSHHLFFVEGGALAVENALKTAFDWKFRKNQQRGAPESEDLEVIHFRHAFHGRSGYTMSLTNTHDPRKFQYFPKFKWPRVSTPALCFPLTDKVIEATIRAEQLCLLEIKEALSARKNRIAALIIETIQGEGGDHHFRPEFFAQLRQLANEAEFLLIFDEVQAGMGLTGSWWAWQQTGTEPDIFSFGKKSQVCGIAANSRVDEVESVFKVASRINSTWGGNLCDMVRAEQYIQIIHSEKLLDNTRHVGAYFIEQLQKLAAENGKMSNIRGQGLMIAFDLPTDKERDQLKKSMFENRAIVLGCGEKSIRFRPALDFTREAVDWACDVIRRSF